MNTSRLSFEDWLALNQLYADYAHTVDAGQWDRWTEFFTDDCVYRVQPRENHERGFPLATLSLTSKGMLKDRAYGIQETLFHDPYDQRHVVGVPRVHEVSEERIRCEANYAVFRTKLSEPSTVFNVGRYLDVVVRTPQGLRFASRECIYDSELIPNSLIYPI
ncbi:MAG: aromatic-ring-hydroxylating dioxygenase subunit beta [Rubrivivax sp.]